MKRLATQLFPMVLTTLLSLMIRVSELADERPQGAGKGPLPSRALGFAVKLAMAKLWGW